MAKSGPTAQGGSGASSGCDVRKQKESDPAVLARKRRWRRIKWTIRLSILSLLLGYFVFWGLDGFFYFPDDKTYYTPEELSLKCEDVYFNTSDGVKLHGLWLPSAVDGKPRGTVVHFHGNAANITGHLPLAAWLPNEGYNVLMFDYRGYGKSEGRVSRTGTIRDGHAAVDYALSRPDVDRTRFFAYAQSLGGAVAVVVAAERPEIRALAVEQTFGSYRGIAARHLGNLVGGPLGRFGAGASISKGYEPVDYVARIAPRPLLVIAGENDTICFPELGRELFDAAAEPREFWLVPGAQHLAILETHYSELMDRVTGFFEKAVKSP